MGSHSARALGADFDGAVGDLGLGGKESHLAGDDSGLEDGQRREFG
ncbi:MAG TPA: hypothetical protein VMK12_24705 [Anaeromyxobacteraceae bacterium]|nr:hypothetical protein [Anaeromyxobacteraceae bacterium]